MHAHPRYRLEDGAHAIDIRVTSVEQLFDNRDPAPFRERDLDPDLVEYLVDAAEDLPRGEPIRIVLWCGAAGPRDGIETAFHAQFDYELDRIARTRRRQRRTGTFALVLGLILLAALLGLAHGLQAIITGTLGEAIREGLVILSWVALWRPVETLIYDWLPVRQRRGLFARLRAAPIAVRVA